MLRFMTTRAAFTLTLTPPPSNLSPMENQNTPTPSGTSPGAASAGSGQTPAAIIPGWFMPFAARPKPNLSAASTEALIGELQRRMNCPAAVHAGEVEPCVILAITPSDLSEYWESDESGATHPGSRIPEPEEWHAIRHAFDRWQDCGNFSDLMHDLRDAWQAEQARQLDAQEGGSR